MKERDYSMIGSYGEWAAGLVPDPPELSLRRSEFASGELGEWRSAARRRTLELLALPLAPFLPEAKTLRVVEREGLHLEELEWSLPYGPPTRALFLRPQRVSGRLPGVLALHDHGGAKYFGWQKIAHGAEALHPLLAEQRQEHYGGRSWANELARRGFAVLVHDVFPFGSRRIHVDQVNPELRDDRAESGTIEGVLEYNRWSAAQESTVAKSLLSAGTTWPGIYLSEDQAALSYLGAREEVDADRIGCCGLSGGGMRTAYLAGIDPRIRAAVCVGFMTTWRDFLLDKSYTHTWMAYTPLLPRLLDFPEVAGLRVPAPLFVQNNRNDQLFTLPEMERAGKILKAVYRKAGAEEALRVEFYPGPHKFDLEMQEDAFAWLAQMLAE